MAAFLVGRNQKLELNLIFTCDNYVFFDFYFIIINGRFSPRALGDPQNSYLARGRQPQTKS